MHLQLSTRNYKLTIGNITKVAMMVAIIEVCKVLMAQIPNVELTSFFIIMFTLCFGKLVLYVIPVFILIEGTMYGFGLWWVMYLYAWPILALVTWKLRKQDSAFTWAMVSGVFGLIFGAMCAIPYLFAGGPYAMFTWWVAGIPWDIVHGVANFAIMLVLYKPLKRVLEQVRQ